MEKRSKATNNKKVKKKKKKKKTEAPPTPTPSVETVSAEEPAIRPKPKPKPRCRDHFICCNPYWLFLALIIYLATVSGRLVRIMRWNLDEKHCVNNLEWIEENQDQFLNLTDQEVLQALHEEHTFSGHACAIHDMCLGSPQHYSHMTNEHLAKFASAFVIMAEKRNWVLKLSTQPTHPSILVDMAFLAKEPTTKRGRKKVPDTTQDRNRRMQAQDLLDAFRLTTKDHSVWSACPPLTDHILYVLGLNFIPEPPYAVGGAGAPPDPPAE